MILDSLQAWLIANVVEVSNLNDGQKVYVTQADQGAKDHVLISRIDGDFHNVLDDDDPHDDRTNEIDIDVKCSTAKRAGDVATAIIAALRNFTGTMGDREVTGLYFQDERDTYEPARAGHVRGRSVVEIPILIHHRAAT